MEAIKNITNEIRKNNGIVREKYADFNLNVGLNYFKEIGQAFIDAQHNKLPGKERVLFELDPVYTIAKMMVEWTYLINEKLDSQKGFILKGHTGRGKTFLFKVWSKFLELDAIKYMQNGDLRLIRPVIVNVRQISSEFQDPATGGNAVLLKYSRINCLVLDDIGAEQKTSSNYGNKINVVEEIIRRREEANMLTFGTTNLNRMEVSKENPDGYDSRTVSRMNSLFNILPVSHETDFRLKN